MIITLLTDFGTADGYVGEMKGVLAELAPDVELVDISHDLSAQDIEGGRLALARYWQRFPLGTVHLAVVDPGVGGTRAAIAVSAAGRFLVGPDNGLLSPALLMPDARAVVLPIPPGASATFHGRDVFAPAAARLAIGMAIDALGPSAASPVIRRTPEPKRGVDGGLHGVIMTIDRFGNAITNLVGLRGGSITVGDRRLDIVRSYVDVPAGAVTALCGSSGLVEIAERDGNAARSLRLTRGASVVYWPPASL
ncbi:MAG TPA: SAM-dependent chlorinase/fluorinase [Gemmatimonadaceae bacterium]|nr:SAM-dependent chlorinase/fluorinase [Gemmatimonadaceae bacterium]